MPNWCNNTLELAHEDPAMIDRAVAALDRGEFLQEFIPVPEDLKIVAGRVGDDDNEAQKKLVEDTERNIKEHGYGNWYDYCVNEWGTKWDVGDEGSTTRDSDTAITTSFDSAWSPPIQAYEKLVEMGFSVRAYYYEPGMNFAGIWDNGDDDMYELPGSSEECREQLPEVLDSMFGISDSIAEYEEENNEEEQE